MAGLIDGDGCFLLYRHVTKKRSKGYWWEANLTIAQSNKAFLEELIDVIGHGRIGKKKNKVTYDTFGLIPYFLALSPNPCRKVIPLIIPHLRRKKRQAELFSDALDILGTKLRDKPDDWNERLEIIASELKKLKRM